MLHIMNTCGQIENLFDHGVFAYDKWEKYMNAICPEAAAMLQETVKKYLNTGNYTFDKDFLPVLNAVYRNPELELLQKSFSTVTDDLNSKIIERFGKELSADLILYLGLGCSAGKVMEIDYSPVILLGIEKILELRWYTRNAMYGLVYHELGHAYHTQHGKLDQTTDDNRLSWVWQLFTEGIAMYFEQTLVGDPDFFHQDTNGWKSWCDEHFEQILHDFHQDLTTMTRFTQRYFGDWCDYHGHGDTGYYLGSRFIHFLRKSHSFHDLINLEISQIYHLYLKFVQRTL